MQVTFRSPLSESETTKDISGKNLAAGLQYGSTAGHEPLIEWCEGLQAYSHGRFKGEGWRLSIGAGSQDLLYKVRILPGRSFIGFLNHNKVVLLHVEVHV